jgi:hypothetical protein
MRTSNHKELRSFYENWEFSFQFVVELTELFSVGTKINMYGCGMVE